MGEQKSLSRQEMSEVMDRVFKECQKLRGEGQKEYARRLDNAFGNFERIGEMLQLSREKVLSVYMLKHLDGVMSWVDGHRSQREPVTGRINDLIVYLCLLRGMVECTETESEEAAPTKSGETLEEINQSMLLLI